jgi:hypothetical protein
VADGPETIARHAIRSLGPLTDSAHLAMLVLLDELIAMNPAVSSPPSEGQLGAERSRRAHDMVGIG